MRRRQRSLLRLEVPQSTRRWLRRCALLLASAVLLPGCLGLGVGSFGTSEGAVDNPLPSVKRDGQRVINAWDLPVAITSDELLEAWGEPDTRDQLPGNREEWTYTAGVRWAGGVVYAVILPVPIALPVGWDHVTFVVESQRVVGARSKVTEFGFVCGVTWAPSWFHGGGWSAQCGGEVTDRFRNPFD